MCLSRKSIFQLRISGCSGPIPGKVVAKVRERIPYQFTMGSHTAAWRHFKIRPQSGAATPEITIGEFCVRDPAHNDYLYTVAWVDRLSKELVDPARFKEI